MRERDELTGDVQGVQADAQDSAGGVGAGERRVPMGAVSWVRLCSAWGGRVVGCIGHDLRGETFERRERRGRRPVCVVGTLKKRRPLRLLRSRFV